MQSTTYHSQRTRPTSLSRKNDNNYTSNMALLLRDLAKSSAVFPSYNKHITHKLIPTNRLQYNVSTHRNQCTYTEQTNRLQYDVSTHIYQCTYTVLTNRLQYDVSAHRKQCTYTVLTNRLQFNVSTHRNQCTYNHNEEIDINATINRQLHKTNKNNNDA